MRPGVHSARPMTNATGGDELIAGKIWLALPDYTRLQRMEAEAKLAQAHG